MILLAFLLLTATLSAVRTQASDPLLGAWASNPPYPIPIHAQSCVASGGYIYCVGGSDGVTVTSAVYFAQLTSSGVGTWTATVSYPTPVANESCGAYKGYIYCIGDFDGSGFTNAVYYASLSTTGLDPSWTATMNYPVAESGKSCVFTPNGMIYCMGGNDGQAPSNYVYFTKEKPEGVAMWARSMTGYPSPVYGEECAFLDDIIMCNGGFTATGRFYANSIIRDVYAADYPLAPEPGYWNPEPAYPTNFAFGQCVSVGPTDTMPIPYFLCVGGLTNGPRGLDSSSSTYYATGPPPQATICPENPPGVTVSCPSVSPGDSVTLSATGLIPRTHYRVLFPSLVIKNRPIPLGFDLFADDFGSGITSFNVPAIIPSGFFSIQLAIQSSSGPCPSCGILPMPPTLTVTGTATTVGSCTSLGTTCLEAAATPRVTQGGIEIIAPFTNTANKAVTGIAYAVVHLPDGTVAAVRSSHQTLDPGATEEFLVQVPGFPAGTYSVTIFVTDTSGTAISESSTTTMTLGPF